MEILGQRIIKNGGIIAPLLIDADGLTVPSSANVSVMNYNGKLLANIRNLNYVLYHSERDKNPHVWGPLVYIHPENDISLTTYNYLCNLNSETLEVESYAKVDTSLLDVPPLWDFVGLEDARIVNWHDQLSLIGVRRDTTTNGVGRMEISQLSLDGAVKEVRRTRIPTTGQDNSYCEKNWMPVLDHPYRFVKWTNETEVVDYNPETKQTTTTILKEKVNLGTGDLRGGSQVFPYNDLYLAVVHEVDLYQSEAGRKNAFYWHRIVAWDRGFNIVSISDPFTFMGGKIEFCVGMTMLGSDFIVTFGFQDNAAYAARIPERLMKEIIKI